MNNSSEMCNDKNVMTCADMITRVFTNIERTDIEKSNKVFSAWRRTTESIRPNGANIAAHSQIIDLKSGILLVETDHPGWIQMLQMHQKYILTGLRRAVPDLHIVSLAFRLCGSGAQLVDVASKKNATDMVTERVRIEQQYAREEQKLAQRGFVAQNISNARQTLPVELQSIFTRFKNEMTE